MTNLLSISDLISLAKARKINFGMGDPKVHLAYLAKLGIIPPAIKRKNKRGELEGHYPESVLETIEETEQMKDGGLSYAQITNFKNDKNPMTNSNYQLPMTNFQNSKWAVAFLIIPMITLIIGILLGFGLGRVGISGSSGFLGTSGVLGAQKTGLSEANTVPAKVIFGNTGIDSTAKTIYLITVPSESENFKNLEKVGGIQIK